jgi:hypothetical protein
LVDDDLTPSGLLASIRSARVAEDAAAAQQLDLAARWADLHPPESIHSAAVFTIPGSQVEEPIAGAGCPLVAEFCVAELGSALGISTAAAKRLMGHALELRHRLTRLWDRVQSGSVPAWRARVVADATIHATPALTAEAAGWVDAQVAGMVERIGPAQLDRLVAEAIKRHHLADDAVDHDEGLAVDPRHATLDTDHVSYAGTMRLEAELGIADALDLDRELTRDAAVQAALGSTESLDVRRSTALGHLARQQTALDLAGLTGDADPTADRAAAPKLPAAREVVLHVHLSAAAVRAGEFVFDPTGRLEEGQRLVLREQVEGWCRDTHTKVTIKPVIDLAARLATDAYEVPDPIRDQVVLRDGTCVFPWCTRPARRCQVDHVIPFDHDAAAEGRPQPGPTASDNLAALCTFHHRLKTHSAWTYHVIGPGRFEWTSPHGHRYRRDPDGGTTRLDHDTGPPPPLAVPRPHLPRTRRP